MWYRRRARKKEANFGPIPIRVAGIVFAALTATSLFWALPRTAAQAREDLPAGDMQARATSACLECHEASIIVQQRLNKAAWTKEVDKMIRWGAVVEAADRDALIDYLSTNFSPDKPPYIAPNTAAVPSIRQKSK